MDIDYGVIIGLIATGSGAAVLALSYVGAYLVGRSHGRRDAERELRVLDHPGTADRLAAAEGAIGSAAHALTRLAEAQRLLVVEQQRAYDRPRMDADPRLRLARPQGHDTPA